jgi:dihydrofolate reductase
MRTVSFGMNISLDGYCDHTSFSPADFPDDNEAFFDYFTGMMDDVDLLFYGRVMYQLMFPYWAEVAENPAEAPWERRFAKKLTSIDKVVVSRTLESVEGNVRIIRDNPVEELRKLKQQPGKKISVDSVSMLPELIAAGLIDEFNLVVHPVLVGKGRRLLDAGSLQENLKLRFVESRVFKSGAVALHYVKA